MISNTDDILSEKHMLADNITEKEKQVIISLAERGTMSGYDFHLGGKDRGKRKVLMSSGKWPKIKTHLGPQGLNYICPVTLIGRPKKEETSKRRKNLYWLTDKGIVYALLNDVNVDLLLAKTKEVYPNDENKALLIKMSKGFPRELLAVILLIHDGNRPIDFRQIALLGAGLDFNIEDTEKILKPFKGSAYGKKVVKALEKSMDKFADLKKFLESE